MNPNVEYYTAIKRGTKIAKIFCIYGYEKTTRQYEEIRGGINNTNTLYIYFSCTHVFVCVHVLTYTWKSEDNLWGSFVSYHVGLVCQAWW